MAKSDDLVAMLAAQPSEARSLRVLADTRVDDWELLVGHGVIDGRTVSGASVRAQYLHLTDRLINVVTSGSFGRVIFLDKSARPVCWLMRHAWKLLSPTFDDGGVASRSPMPQCTFLNIDRLQWRELMDPSGAGRYDVDEVPTAAVDGLRRLFDVNGAGTRSWMTESRVLVVDEVRVSGDTSKIAAGILGRAFPNSTFVATQWMSPKLVTRNGNRYNNQLPVWYRADSHLGRGVGDRDPSWAEAQSAWRTRAGAYFTSRPLEAPDPLSERLRLELRALAGSLLRGDTPLFPDFDRTDIAQRCQLFNGIELIELRKLREAHAYVLDL